MPIQKIDDEELLDRLTDVFRQYGYEGATLTRITAATGLQRASLYHRFPGGKDEMVQVVLARAGRWLTERVLAPLSGLGTPVQRIRMMAERLHAFYAGGRRSCLLDSLSFGTEQSELKRHIKAGMTAWASVLAAVAREAGLPARVARERAEDAIAQIQGSLVLARALKETGPFERTLKQLPSILTGAKGGGR